MVPVKKRPPKPLTQPRRTAYADASRKLNRLCFSSPSTGSRGNLRTHPSLKGCELPVNSNKCTIVKAVWPLPDCLISYPSITILSFCCLETRLFFYIFFKESSITYITIITSLFALYDFYASTDLSPFISICSVSTASSSIAILSVGFFFFHQLYMPTAASPI